MNTKMQAHTKTTLSPLPFTPAPSGLLQRKCACGNHTMAGGECEECEKKQALQRASLSPRGRGAERDEGEVPLIVHEALRSPGQPLEPATRAFFEPRLGHDFSQVQAQGTISQTPCALTIGTTDDHFEQEAEKFAEKVLRLPTQGTPAHVASRLPYDLSRVRIHADARAFQSARTINANAYTVGNHIVFNTGGYSPATRAGRALLAHELAHVVQQTGTVLRRDEAAPPVNKWDRIAKEVFGYDNYEEYLSNDLKSTTFFGQSLSNINDETVRKLQKVETDLKAKKGASYTAPPISSTLRKRKGMHAWGMAIDFDVLRNPYVLYESGEGELDKELLSAYDHIAQFMLGDSQSSLRKLKLGRKAFGSGSVGEVYDALRRESDAMKKYFSMKDDDAAIANYIANEWSANHQGQTLPDVGAVKAQMKEDYEVLGGRTGTGAKRPTGGKGDRPFAPTSSGGQGDPSTGFLNLGKEFVEAMTDAGFAWGAIDIAGEPGDIQHFDLRLIGTGAKAYNLTLKYK
jgi:hypothetical protein